MFFKGQKLPVLYQKSILVRVDCTHLVGVDEFQVPAGVPPGIAFHAQAAALIPPNSLPNGQNPLGIVLSNAIRSIVQPY